MTDDRVRQDVQQELKWDARLQPNEVGVTVHNGIATLAGWVGNQSRLRLSRAARVERLQ
jgi:osmotically-inducible protein OsmY